MKANHGQAEGCSEKDAGTVITRIERNVLRERERERERERGKRESFNAIHVVAKGTKKERRTEREWERNSEMRVQ